MNIIGKELVVFFLAWVVMMSSTWVSAHINQTLGVVIDFICIAIAAYAFFIGQRKLFKYWKAKGLFRDKPSDSNDSTGHK